MADNTNETKLEILALWANESKNGTLYYTGHLNGLRVVAFPNTNKRNEKEPDLRIYVQAKPKEGNTQQENNSDYEDAESIPF
jgi:uncharacterized protein (DUF736 family)